MNPASKPMTISEDAIAVLDIDDTLYLEQSYVQSGFRAVGSYIEKTKGVSGLGATLWSNFISGVRGDAFDRALPKHGIKPEPRLIETLIELYRCHTPLIQLAPDAERFLNSLQGRKAAAITDGPMESQRKKAHALGLDRYLSPIIFTDDLGPGMSKPHQRAFELVEDALDGSPSDCVYVGDNPTKDFVAPQHRGWGSVRIRRSSSLHFGVPSPAGVAEIASFDELSVKPEPSVPARLQGPRRIVR